jgi:hypothetical protein
MCACSGLLVVASYLNIYFPRLKECWFFFLLSCFIRRYFTSLSTFRSHPSILFLLPCLQKGIFGTSNFFLTPEAIFLHQNHLINAYLHLNLGLQSVPFYSLHEVVNQTLTSAKIILWSVSSSPFLAPSFSTPEYLRMEEIKSSLM